MDGFALPQDMPVHDPDDPASPPPLPFGPRDWPRDMDEAAFIAFTAARPEKERWELWDGEPRLMNPGSFRHQRVAARLSTRLDDHFLDRSMPFVCAPEVGIRFAGYDDFLAVADLAVLHQEDAAKEYPGNYVDRFVLAAEIVSPSNTMGEIATKVARYREHAECLYVLTLAQDEPSLTVSARDKGWAERRIEGAGAMLDLPTFGFEVALSDIYSRIIGH